MMNKLIALTALSASAVSAAISPELKENLATLQRDGIAADSSFGRHLVASSRRVEEQYENDISFVSNYSIKFMGCHHVTQWASEEEQEDNGDDDAVDEDANLNAANNRIRSKGLVRFRLCPSDSCFDHFGAGCSKDYGEYVVDMYKFLEVYVAWQMENTEYQCSTYRSTCYKECYESSSANCYTSCYKKYGVNAAFCSNQNQYGETYDESGNQFSLEDYLACGEYEILAENEDELSHYLGPYCAAQNGDIKLGFFQDQYCSIPSAYQANYFEKITGVEIPYTKQSLISSNCLSCEATEDYQANNNGQQMDYYNYDEDGNKNYYVAQEVNDMCGTMYMMSGKCETEFNADDVPYPEEGACTYIEGVKRLKDDGIIRSDQKISSKPAAIAIGVFSGAAAMLGGYVYYLKSKIARSRVNLAGATTSLA